MFILNLQDRKGKKLRNKKFGPHLIFTLSRLVGCFHFDNHGKSSFTRIMYSVIMLSLIASAHSWISHQNLVRCLQSLKTQAKEKTIEGIVNCIVAFGSITFVLINSGAILISKKAYPMVMKNIKHFEVHRMNVCLGFLALVAFCFTFYFQVVKDEYLLSNVSSNIVSIQHVLFTTQYIILSNRWNCYLKLLIKSAAKFDERMMKAHANVIHAHKLLNGTYGVPILLSVLIAFIVTVQKLFIFYASIKSKVIEYPTIFPVAFYSVLIYWVASVSDYSSFLADEFNRVLFEVMNKDTRMLKQTTLRLYLVKKYSISFTACGFFTVGHPFVTSLIAAAVTYLVVLIQFAE